jgi:hypothetical protein
VDRPNLVENLTLIELELIRCQNNYDVYVCSRSGVAM